MIGLGTIPCIVFHIVTILISTSNGNSLSGYVLRSYLDGTGQGASSFYEASTVCRENGGVMATLQTPELYRMAVNQIPNTLGNLFKYFKLCFSLITYFTQLVFLHKPKSIFSFIFW